MQTDHRPGACSSTSSILCTLAATVVLAAGVAAYSAPTRAQTPTLPSSGTIAVPTYEAAGLYWQDPGGSNGCEARFRKWGDTAWAQGLDLWYDARDSQCRGSLVGLTPNTDYQVEFNLPGQAATHGLVFKTWSNQLPVATTIAVNAGAGTLNVAQGGIAAGYVVYEGNGATLDAGNAAQYNVTINASYVIVRGLTLKGAQQDAIRISPTVTNVVIEDNDISGWGRQRSGNWGVDMDSAVRAVCTQPTLMRVTVQRNKIYNPRYSSNSWSDGHPAGPRAIAFSHCGGNHVFRHNDIYSTNGNYFNDIIGGEDNITKAGFPNSDTDIYGNKLSHAWDDAIEAEGANENVRIWGNYIDRTAIGIATSVTSVGPVYIFRNVWNRSQFKEDISSLDEDDRQPFFKSGSDESLGNGRRYVFHNTMLQATQAGLTYGLGGGYGMGGTGSTQLINNTFSKNNIYHLWKPGANAFYQTGSGNEIANELYSGTPGDAAIVNGINGTPIYAPGHGWQSEAAGNYQLAPSTPGYGMGVRIANFNDNAAAPDVGAHQSGTEAMKFGIAGSPGPAAGEPPVSGSSSNVALASAGGSASASSTYGACCVVGVVNNNERAGSASGGSWLDATPGVYPDWVQIAFHGMKTIDRVVVYTLQDNHANPVEPTDTLTFNGYGLRDFSVQGWNGSAWVTLGSITNNNLVKRTFTFAAFTTDRIRVLSTRGGDGYSRLTEVEAWGVPAGPSTSTTPSITLGSTANPSTVGQYVTYTAVVSGSSGTPTGTIVFRDNGAIISGCGGLVMANGRASCTIGNQGLGTHSMTAVYSGGGLYGGITSSTLPQVVNAAKANTPSITLGSSVNPSTVSQYVELTAVVSGAAGTPTGTLVFLDNGDAISGCGGLPMTNGRATCTPGGLTQGTHSITVVYSGNGTYNGVTSSTLPHTVGAAKANAPSFTLGSSQNPSMSGNVVTFTAVLSGPAGTPTGTVVFRDNGQMISGCGGLALTGGQVSCSPMLNTLGTHSITAIYLGDSNYNGITSSVVPQTVQ